jgi:hypothetical protein
VTQIPINVSSHPPLPLFASLSSTAWRRTLDAPAESLAASAPHLAHIPKTATGSKLKNYDKCNNVVGLENNTHTKKAN